MGDPPSDPGVKVSDICPHESFASVALPLKPVGHCGVVLFADATLPDVNGIPGVMRALQSVIVAITRSEGLLRTRVRLP